MRVFDNLFSNLLKYTSAHSQVDLTLQQHAQSVLCTLRDRGIGVSQEELERIFEPFYRSDLSRSRKTGGTGLGLSLVKRIVSVHGGQVWATLPEDQEGGLMIHLALKRESSLDFLNENSH